MRRACAYPCWCATQAGAVRSPSPNSELVSLIDLPRMTLRWAGAGSAAPEAEAEVQQISIPAWCGSRTSVRVWHGVRTRTPKLVLAEGGGALAVLRFGARS